MTEPEIEQDSRPVLTVEKLVYGGEGLARQDGRVVLAPYVLPGERIAADLSNVKGNPAMLRSVEVLEASPSRIAPGCPYFTVCGGCHLQHAPYEMQLEQKRLMLCETLRRIGKFEPPAEIGIVSADPWAYRNRVQLHVKKGRIGYLEAKSHSLVPISHCPISSPRINAGIDRLRDMTRDRRFPDFVRSIELFTNETETQLNVLETERPVAKGFFEWAAKEIGGVVSGPIDYEASGFTFRVGYRSFFQVNRFLVDALVETALRDASGARAFDLYAGVGLFTLPLTARFQEVTAIESSANAIRDLAFNAQRAGRSIEAVQGSVDGYLADVTTAPDFVLADPPRSGLEKRVVAELVRLKPQKIVIVSCEAPTLARDLTRLLAEGYQIERMTLVDLFPQTYHFEVVAELSLSPELRP